MGKSEMVQVKLLVIAMLIFGCGKPWTPEAQAAHDKKCSISTCTTVWNAPYDALAAG